MGRLALRNRSSRALDRTARQSSWLAIALVWALPGWGSNEVLHTVAQPIGCDGIAIAEVPYVSYDSDKVAELLLTTQPNLVAGDAGARDRNLAVAEGIRFVKEPPNEWDWRKRQWPRMQGDTLEVRVDLSAMKPLTPATPGGRSTTREWREAVLTATLWCGIRNSRACWPEVTHIRYHFTGSDEYDRYEGAYSIDPMEPLHWPIVWERRMLVVPGGRSDAQNPR